MDISTQDFILDRIICCKLGPERGKTARYFATEVRHWYGFALRTAAISCSSLIISLALTSPVLAQDETYHFNIESQEADKALISFAQQAGVAVLFPAAQVSEARANPLLGRYTLEQGLDRLLENTGFAASLNEQGTLVVKESLGVKADKTGFIAALNNFFNSSEISDTPSGSPRRAVEELVVEAERRVTNIQDTPISVASINAELIQQYSLRNLRELAEFVPNLIVAPAAAYGNASPSINIRGIGAGSPLYMGIASDRSVGIYIDGLFFARNPGSLMNLADIEKVEVLRGPQGTLFGRNTTGGAVLYHTTKPKLNEFFGYLELQAGEFDELNIAGSVNLPITDNWSVKAQYADIQRDGYVQRGPIDLGNVDDQVARLALGGQPSDKLTLDLGLSYINSDSNGEPAVLVGILFPEQGPVNDFGATSLLLEQRGEPAFVDNDPRLILGDFKAPAYCVLDDKDPFTLGARSGLCDTYRRGNLVVGTVGFSYEFNDRFNASWLSGVLDGKHENRTDTMWSGSYARDFGQYFKSTQHELQIDYRGDGWHGVTGIIYYREKAREKELTTELRLGTFGGIDGSVERVLHGSNIVRRDEHYSIDTESIALFGQASYALGEKLNFVAGVRFTQDEKQGTIRLVPTQDDPRNRIGTGAESWQDLDWRLALEFHPSDDLMLYLSQSKAYRAGIANDGSIEPMGVGDSTDLFFIAPENVISNEFGVRSEWFDRRLRFNLSIYDQNWTDRQSQNVEIATSGDIIVITQNEPNVTSRGVEIDFYAAISAGLAVTGTVGTIDAQQKHQPGFILESVPKKSWRLGLDHLAILPNGATINTSLNYAWRDGTYAFSVTPTTEEDSLNYNPGYGLLNGRVAYASANGKWDLALYGTNLTNRKYNNSKFSIGGEFTFSGLRGDVKFPARPRLVGIQWRYNF